jgi:hypothetical protein
LRGLLIGLIVAMPVGSGKLAMLSSHFSMGPAGGFASGMGAATEDAGYAKAAGLCLRLASGMILIYSNLNWPNGVLGFLSYHLKFWPIPIGKLCPNASC